MQAHVIAFLKAKFNVEVEKTYLGFYIFNDEGQSVGCDDNSAYAAAMDYAACYDGELFDKLDGLQAGV